MKYKITAYATFEVVTLVEAEDEEEAKRKSFDRDVSVCIHGSAMTTEIDEIDFVLADGAAEGVENFYVEEYIE